MDIHVKCSGRTLSLTAPDGDHIGRVISSSGTFYEEEMLLDLARLLQPNDIVLDVGANIGNHVVFFATVAQCRVHAFEPNPRALEFLSTNVERNGLGKQVTLHPQVVGVTPGHVGIVHSPDGNLGATRFGTGGEGEFPVMTLDALIATETISLLKIDAEGMDFDVLLGAEQLIRRCHPTIAIECQSVLEFERVEGWLNELGYAAMACYNATETYVFLPISMATGHQEVMTRFLARQVLRTQLQVRHLRKVHKRMGVELSNLRDSCPSDTLVAHAVRLGILEENVRKISMSLESGDATSPSPATASDD